MKKLTKKKKEVLLGTLALLTAVTLLLVVALAFVQEMDDDPAAMNLPTRDAPTEAPATEPEEDSGEPELPANPYGPGDFRFEDGYLTCTAGESLLGVDVSEHQGEIDWQQVADAGIEFAIIRVGFRGYGSGKLVADEMAVANIEGAQAAGLKVGAYFYSQAISVEEAIAEAEFAMEILAGYTLDMPLVYDWEYVSADARTGSTDSDTVTACTAAFCDTVRDGGYTPMYYSNLDLAGSLFQLSELRDYPFWLAMYSDQMTYLYKISMWQYTASGTVPGIDGGVDLNLYFPETME